MGFTLIKGTFHVKNYSPDGDSLRFQANSRASWDLLDGQPVRINAREHVQLRLEGIDALETHYTVPGRTVHQPLDLANAATDFLLASANITGVQWDANHRIVTHANDATEGYILSRKTDRYGRPISFAFAGPAPEGNGQDIYLTVARMRESLNYQSLATGRVYPLYYSGLFFDLRNAMTDAVLTARQEGRGFWPRDKSSAVTVNDITSITDTHPIFPKLFRRLADYLVGFGSELQGFKEYLEARQEQVFILSRQQFTHFDTVVEVEGQTVRMTAPPEDLVFTE